MSAKVHSRSRQGDRTMPSSVSCSSANKTWPGTRSVRKECQHSRRGDGVAWGDKKPKAEPTRSDTSEDPEEASRPHQKIGLQPNIGGYDSPDAFQENAERANALKQVKSASQRLAFKKEPMGIAHLPPIPRNFTETSQIDSRNIHDHQGFPSVGKP